RHGKPPHRRHRACEQRLHGENAAARRFLKEDWPIPVNGQLDSESASLGFGACHATKTSPPVLGWRQAGMRLKGAVEGADRAEASVERDRQDRYGGLRGIAQRGFGFGQAIAVNEGAEIAMAELPVDQMAQPMFRNVEFL